MSYLQKIVIRIAALRSQSENVGPARECHSCNLFLEYKHHRYHLQLLQGLPEDRLLPRLLEFQSILFDLRNLSLLFKSSI